MCRHVAYLGRPRALREVLCDPVLVSEPYDDGPGWHDVPDGSVVLATATGVDVTPLCTP